jgi:aminoglycoside phosphotransferase (APT) family kinase protein
MAIQDEPALRQCLERILPRVSDRQSTITAIHCRLSEVSTSYETQILSVRLSDGRWFRVFLKNYGAVNERAHFITRQQDEIEQMREREVRVYQGLLEDANLGTPKYYDVVRDEARETYWLLLEYVDGTVLHYLESNYWIAAAGWLGRMHGYFARYARYLSQLDFLVHHDTRFFSAKAEAALDGLSRVSPGWVDRLATIVDRYDQVVEAMVAHQPTLIHGSFRPYHIIVSGESQLMRICACDWERAAFGAPLYDLAYLSDGFKAPTLDLMFEMYRQGAMKFGLYVPRRERMRYVVNCFRLHKIVSSLAKAPSWMPRNSSSASRFREHRDEKIVKLLAVGEEIREQIRDRY